MLTMNYERLSDTYGRKKKKKSVTKANTRKKNKKCKEKKITSSEDYQDLLKDERWKKKRKEVLKRDNYKCILCGSMENLQVHHTRYKGYRMPWNYKLETLVTLCEDCHKKVHTTPTHQLFPIIDE